MRETPDQTLTRIAAPTGGVCRRTDLLDAGMSPSAIDRRRRSGYLVPVAGGVYEIPQLSTTDTALWRPLVAVTSSVLSRESAAQLHKFNMPAPIAIHVTAPKGTGRSLPGCVIHESRWLREEDRQLVSGVPVTSPERTFFDLAGSYGVRRLRHLIDEHYAGRSPAPFLACVMSLARPGLPGVKRLRQLTFELADDEPLAASELEHRVWLGLNLHGIVSFKRQVRPPWYDGRRGIVDFARSDIRTIIEADSRGFHTSFAAMSSDRARDRQALASGWLVIRVTWHEIVHRSAATFAEIANIVAQRERSLAALAA